SRGADAPLIGPRPGQLGGCGGASLCWGQFSSSRAPALGGYPSSWPRLTKFLFALQARNTVPTILNVSAIQARSYAPDQKAAPPEVSSILEQRIRGVQEEASLAETGRVLSVGYVRAPHHGTASFDKAGWAEESRRADCCTDADGVPRQ